jgi:hypothetical protein
MGLAAKIVRVVQHQLESFGLDIVLPRPLDSFLVQPFLAETYCIYVLVVCASYFS